MSHYQELIREAIASTGDTRTDDATCAIVEDLMRTNRSGLDHLSRDEFMAEAAGWLAEVDAPFVRDYCDALQLEVPQWAVRQRSAT